MTNRKRWVLFLLVPWALTQLNSALAGNDSYCNSHSALLSLVNRPTIADSACTVPNKKMMIESGMEFERLPGSKDAQNFPETEVRMGLPKDREFYVFLPNYIHQSIIPRTGSSSTSLGIKQVINSTKYWIVTLDGSITPPSGSYAFGNKGTEGMFSGIVNIDLNSSLTLTSMTGVNTKTQSRFDAGQRFNSVNWDVFLTFSPNDQTQIYGEIYGETKTGPNLGSGYNFDCGLVVMISPFVTADIEVGQRIHGLLGGFEHYLGTGFAVLF